MVSGGVSQLRLVESDGKFRNISRNYIHLCSIFS